MSRSNWIGIGFIGLILVLLAVGVTLRPHSNAGTSPAPLVGHQAPNFSLANTAGQVVSLSNFRGSAILLNFWATWCTPCRTEMPLINRTYQTHHRSLRVMAVDLQEPASDVNSFARHYRLAFRPLLDSSGTVSDLYRISPNSPKPVTFWVDKGGVIRFIHYGQMEPSDVRTGLQKASV